jgi:putative CocE/NonD family hydrolase
MLHIGGWFDPHLRGTLKLYDAMKTRSEFPQRLTIGPWTHLPWGRRVGEKDYGIESVSPVDSLQIQWFDFFLKGKKSDFLDKPPLYLFEMGVDRWRYLEDLATENARTYYLASEGLAGIREDDGKLHEALTDTEIEDTIVHDPWRPVPSLGGHSALPGGVFDRSALDCRSDILTYTSEPLEQDLTILGTPSVQIFCQSDATSFDLHATLSEVTDDGKVFPISGGYIRINRPLSPVQIPLQATFITIPRHRRIRLSIAASCFPAHPVNPGTGSLPRDTRAIDLGIHTIQLFCQGKNPSQISFPSIG